MMAGDACATGEDCTLKEVPPEMEPSTSVIRWKVGTKAYPMAEDLEGVAIPPPSSSELGQASMMTSL